MDSENRKIGMGRIAWSMVDIVVFVVSIVVAVLLLMAYIAPHINPNRSLWFAYIGLGAPFLYITNLVLFLFWAVRWRKTAIGLGIVALLGIGHVSKFFKPPIEKVYEHTRTPGSIRILSYNVEGFFGRDSLGVRDNQLDEIATFIREIDPDIICLQEFELNKVNPRIRVDSLLGAWTHNAFFFTAGDGDPSGRGLAIYSKYRVFKRGGIHYPESNNASMWADIAIHRDTLRIYNNHLQTTQVNEQDKAYWGTGQVLSDSTREERFRDILGKLGRNFKVRADQVDSVSQIIHDGTPRVVVCGDFNDTPMSYTYRKMRGNFDDAFCEKGRGVIATYRGLLGVFRIDYLFLSDDLVTLHYNAEQIRWSDHNPVVVDLKFR